MEGNDDYVQGVFGGVVGGGEGRPHFAAQGRRDDDVAVFLS